MRDILSRDRLTVARTGRILLRVSARNLVYEALALRARESPGGSRILTLMTAESGLVDVFVFGGPKSKLRSLAAPYAAGRAFVYLDPVKDFQKLSDFEVRESFPALRENLDRLWSAGLVAELLIKTSGGGGDYPRILDLALRCLAALDSCLPSAFEPPLLLFLWRFVELLGIGPDPSSCSGCGTELRPSKVGPDFLGAYSFALEGFLCPSCASRAERVLHLGVGAFRWLIRSLELDYDEALRLVILPETLRTLKILLFSLARAAAETPLASLDAGAFGAESLGSEERPR
jgi:DNA repair protein RecO (recombination protein O)